MLVREYKFVNTCVRNFVLIIRKKIFAEFAMLRRLLTTWSFFFDEFYKFLILDAPSKILIAYNNFNDSFSLPLRVGNFEVDSIRLLRPGCNIINQ